MPDESKKSSGRFFVEALPASDDEFELPPSESAHAKGSRRLSVGAFITLFDGSGWDVEAEITAAVHRRLCVRPVARIHVGPPFPISVTCATALPKGSREDMLVSRCAELGVTKLVPVEFERSVVRPSVHWQQRLRRWRRLAVEAAKQSGASTVMELEEPVTLDGLVNRAVISGGLRLVGDPNAEAVVAIVPGREQLHGGVTYLVGPEGGLTEAEFVLVRNAGFLPVRIAATTLRIETAAVAFGAVVVAMVVAQCGQSR